MDYHEHEGLELPEWKNDRQLFCELNLNFVVRITCDREGTTYFEVAQDGHQSFYSFPFKGIEYKDAILATIDFEQRLSRFLIRFGMYPLFWALYREKETDQNKRSEAYEKISKNFETYFKSILKPKRERAIATSEHDGLRITNYAQIESGRTPQSANEVEREKKKFIQKIFDALKEIENRGGKKIQLDVGTIIFENIDDADPQSRIKHSLTKYGLKWKDILAEHNLQKKAKN